VFTGGPGVRFKSALSPTLSRKRERGLSGMDGKLGVNL
jgi:hypothetical protein